MALGLVSMVFRGIFIVFFMILGWFSCFSMVYGFSWFLVDFHVFEGNFMVFMGFGGIPD